MILKRHEANEKYPVKLGDVVVVAPETLQEHDNLIDNLREALAEAIVSRGEYVMRKEAMLMQASDNQPIFPGDTTIEFKLDKAGVEAFQRLRESFMTVQEALEAQKAIAEAAAKAKAEQEGLEILKAVLIEQAEEVWPNCEGCLDYDVCHVRDEVPDIDLDGQPLD